MRASRPAFTSASLAVLALGFVLGPAAAQAPASSRPGAPTVLPGSAPAAADAVDVTDRRAVIERANAWLNSVNVLTGDFVQTGQDGRRFSGKLYLSKPGRLRFEYEPPATLEVIADGSSVAIRDRKLATQDLVGIGQTPLKFLLRESLDLSRDTNVLGVAPAGETVSVRLEDRATFGGTSRITLFFDRSSFALRRWTIRDPQGFETNVSLANLDTRTRPPASLFRINYDVQRDSNSNR